MPEFRSCMLGHYNRLCHVIMCKTHETWGLIYSHAMRTVSASCHMLPHHAVRMWASWPPYVYVACKKLLMDMPCVPAKQYLTKLTSSHFSTLNMDFANQNMLKRILIAMHNENTANCNENFRICAEEPVAPPYKW